VENGECPVYENGEKAACIEFYREITQFLGYLYPVNSPLFFTTLLYPITCSGLEFQAELVVYEKTLLPNPADPIHREGACPGLFAFTIKLYGT